MDMNQTPSANRIHIGFFGRRNAGKSSIVNAVTGQETAIVSHTKGTTTDPVSKAMELLPLGPVIITDTPGFDDEGALGIKRVQRTRKVLDKTDAAVLVIDAYEGMQKCDYDMIDLFKEKSIPYIVVYNKSDLLYSGSNPCRNENEILVSAQTRAGIAELKNLIAAIAKPAVSKRRLVGDLLNKGDLVILVTPIDSSAPKGRIILPQQQMIRDILDSNAMAIVVKETELNTALSSCTQKPAMVITDSQVFNQVSKLVPPHIPLTSFSILMARFKGILEFAAPGAFAIDSLKDGDKVLICEGCTHHRQCEDIGTVKLPAWLRTYTGKALSFHNTSGSDFPEDLSMYSLIIHCGGCMLNSREIQSRIKRAVNAKIPITNYGTAIAYINGILKRSLEPLPDILSKIQ